MTVPDGIAEVIAALEASAFGDPFDGALPQHPLTWPPRRDIPAPLFDLRLSEEDLDAVARDAALGLADDGPAHARRSRRRSPRTLGARHAVAVSSCTAALHLAYLAAGVGPGRRGDRAVVHVRRDRRRGAVLRRARRCSPTSSRAQQPGDRPGGRRGADHAAHEGGAWPCTSPATPRPSTGCADAVRRARPRADRGRRARPDAPRWTGASSAPAASPARSASSRTRSSRSARAACSSTDDDEVAAFARSRALARDDERHVGAPPAAHRQPTTSSALGFNYRIDEPRAALLLSRLRRLRGRHRAPPRADAPLPRSCWPTSSGLIVPFSDAQVADLLVLRDADHARAAPSARRSSARGCASAGIQTSSSIRRSTSSPPTASASRASRCRTPSWPRAARSRCRCLAHDDAIRTVTASPRLDVGRA